MQRIPSTQALRALECFARLGAVRKVADELHITRSAVSHQLRLLERDLGFALFDRVGTRIVLTSRGRTFASDVQGALAMISGSASRNAGRGLTGQLTISCPPGFAASWLCPRIARFRGVCPEISLSIVTPAQLDDVSNPDADLFVAFGALDATELHVELLKEVTFTPLVSPVLLNRVGGLQEPADILRGDLLHLADRNDWAAWGQLANLPKGFSHSGIVFADMNLVYAAALNAQGIAMGDEFICHNAMKSGQLVRPFELAINSPKSYYLAIPPAKADIANVAAFRGWILDELTNPDT